MGRNGKKFKKRNVLNAIFRIFMAIVLISTTVLGDFTIPGVKEANKAEAYSGTIKSYIKAVPGTAYGASGLDRTCASKSGFALYSSISTSYDNNKYVKYENAVVFGSTTYDLYVYPRKINGSKHSNAFVGTDKPKVGSAYNGTTGSHICAYKLVVKDKSGNPVDWTGVVGMCDCDLDTGTEYIGFKAGMFYSKGFHKGSKLVQITSSSGDAHNKAVGEGFVVYRGNIKSDSDAQKYNTCAVYGTAHIPTSGMELIHGSVGQQFASSLAFDFPTSVTMEFPDYQVTFNGNGGTGVPSTLTLAGSTVTGSVTATPTRANYTFDGWSADSGAHKFKTASGWTIFDFLENSGGTLQESGSYLTLNLTAQWTYSPAATPTPRPTSTPTPIPTFDDSPDWGNLIIDPNGGTYTGPVNFSSGTLKYIYGDKAPANGRVQISVPTYPGYTFAGWVLDGAGKDYASVSYPNGYGNPSIVQLVAGRNFSITAQWTTTPTSTPTPTPRPTSTPTPKPTTYLITFNPNGGSGAPSDVRLNGASATSNIGSTIPTRSGYEFCGWTYLDYRNNPTSSYRISYFSGVSGAWTTSSSWTFSTYKSKTGYTGSGTTLSLYAVWKEQPYTITFNANGGSGTPSNITFANTSSTSNIGSVMPTRTGYRFCGWTSSSYKDSPTSSYRISYFSGVSGASTTSSSWTFSTYKSKTGYTGSSTTLSLYATWTPITYSITYDYAGGSVSTTNPTTYTIASSTFTLNNPTRSGYSFAGYTGTGLSSPSTSVSIPSGSTGDRSYTATWTPDTYSVTYNGNGNTGGSTPGSQTKTYGVNLTLRSNTGNLVREGYDFEGWNTNSSGTGTSYAEGGSYTANSGITLYAKWKARTDTKYTVEHYKQNINGTYPSRPTNTQNYTGTTDTSVTPSYRSYTGFTSPAKQTATIKGDGSLVVVYRYTRNSYTLTTAKGTGIASTSGDGSVKYEGTKTVSATVKPGYTWSGWTSNNSSVAASSSNSYTIYMPASSVTLTANATPNTNTAYVVKHYKQNLDGTYNSEPDDTDEYTGTTDTSVSPAVKTYVGFASPAVQTVNIDGDGSRIVTYKYARNSYTLTTVKGTGIASTSGDGSVKYEGTKTVSATVKPGYTWSGWTSNNSGVAASTSNSYTITMPAGNVTLTANATPNTNTAYVVKHYKQNLDGTYNSEPDDTDEYTGTTDTSVSPAVKTYAGFTAPEVQTVNIDGDGSRVVTYKYTRNSYTLTTAKGAGIASTSGDGSVKYEDTKTVSATIKPGYTWSGWTSNNSGVAASTSNSYTITMPAGSVTLTANATPNTNTAYVVKHYKQNLDGTYNSEPDDTDEYTGTTDTSVSPAVKTYTGFTSPAVQTVNIDGDGSRVVTYRYTRNSYTLTVTNGFKIDKVEGGSAHLTSTAATWTETYQYEEPVSLTGTPTIGYHISEWSGTGITIAPEHTEDNPFSFTMPAGDVTLVIKAAPNTDTPYKVEHYIQILDKPVTPQDTDNYRLMNTDPYQGTTDTNASAPLREYVGFTAPDENTTTNIDGDGSAVVRYYYTRNTYEYTVHVWEQNIDDDEYTQNEGASYTDTALYEATVHVPVPERTGFTGLPADDFEMPANNDVVVDVYYNRNSYDYRVEFYQQKIEGDPEVHDVENYDLVDADTFYGRAKYDKELTPDRNEYYGFDTPDAITFRIEATDDNVVRYYYPRKIYYYTVNIWEENADNDKMTLLESTVYDSIYERENPVTVPERTGFITPESQTVVTITDTMMVNVVYYREKYEYTVNHYTKNLKSDDYTLQDVETLEAKYGANITPDVKAYVGFTAPETESFVVPSEDGTVVDYYYERNKYQLTLTATFPNGVETMTGAGEYEYEDTATIAFAEKQGYDWNGWKGDTDDLVLEEGNSFADRTASFTVSANDLELIADVTPGRNTPYRVEHYLPNIGANDSLDYENDYILAATDCYSGVTDSMVLPPVHAYGLEGDDAFEGFTAPEPIEVQISGQGTTVVRYLYSRNAYDVVTEHYLQNEDRTDWILQDADTESIPFGDVYTGTIRTYDGFISPVEYESVTVRTNSNVIRYYYERRSDLIYGGRYFKQNLDGSYDVIPDDARYGMDYYGSTVLVETPDFDGFITPEAVTIVVGTNENDNTIDYYYERRMYPYTVNHYVQKLGDTEYELYESDTISEMAFYEEVVTPDCNVYEGCELPALQSLVISTDETVNVVNYYYTRTGYNVIYVDRDLATNQILGQHAEIRHLGEYVSGEDMGVSTADNAYHNRYRYSMSDAAVVTEEGAEVTRYFDFIYTSVNGTVDCSDPFFGVTTKEVEVYLLKNGERINYASLAGGGIGTYAFDMLPMYDENGQAVIYDVELRYHYNFYVEGLIHAPEGAKFTMSEYADQDGLGVEYPKSFVSTANTDEDVVFYGLDDMIYKIVQTQAPTGWTFEKKEMWLNIAAEYEPNGKIISVAFLLQEVPNETGYPEERLLYSTIDSSVIDPELREFFWNLNTRLIRMNVYALAEDAETLLPGATFNVFDSNGYLTMISTDNAGHAVVENLLPDSYRLEETLAPSGYECSKEPIDIEIKKGDREVSAWLIHNKIRVALPTATPTPKPKDNQVSETIEISLPTPSPTAVVTPAPVRSSVEEVMRYEADPMSGYQKPLEAEALPTEAPERNNSGTWTVRVIESEPEVTETDAQPTASVKPLEDGYANVERNETVPTDIFISEPTVVRQRGRDRELYIQLTKDHKLEVQTENIGDVAMDTVATNLGNLEEGAYYIEGYIFDWNHNENLKDENGEEYSFKKFFTTKDLVNGKYKVNFSVNPDLLEDGEYTVTMYLYDRDGTLLQVISDTQSRQHTFKVSDQNTVIIKKKVVNFQWWWLLLLLLLVATCCGIAYGVKKNQDAQTGKAKAADNDQDDDFELLEDLEKDKKV